jgi:hypothetical protein
MKRAMFLVKSSKPIREMTNFQQYCAMTAQIDESLVDEHVSRFFTEDCDALVALMKADNEVIDAEFFYWFEGRENM